MAKPINVVLIAQPIEVYDAQGHPTGTFRPRAQRQTAHMVDIVLHLKKEYDPTTKTYKYVSEMTKCRFQRGYNKTIENVTYDKLVKILKEDLGITVLPVSEPPRKEAVKQ